MRICLITGSYPPQVCGVGDYTGKLAQSLQLAGSEITVFHRKSWSFLNFYKYLRELRMLKADVYLMQYPTEGYGYSIVPQMLAFGLLGKHRIVTLHEYSRKSLKGKLAIYLFFLSGCDFIFTNRLDANFARRWAPWLGLPRIIPIGSNIPWSEARPPSFDLVYFGLIRPLKGIEEFMREAHKFKQRLPNARVVMVADVPRGYESYAEEVFGQARNAGFIVKAGMDMENVGNVLRRTKIGFFPFAEGLSERRGSVLAAMGNGCLIVGNGFEPGANQEFRCAAIAMHSELDLLRIYEMNEEGAFQDVKENSRVYCRSRSWDSIALAHCQAFREMIA